MCEWRVVEASEGGVGFVLSFKGGCIEVVGDIATVV